MLVVAVASHPRDGEFMVGASIDMRPWTMNQPRQTLGYVRVGSSDITSHHGVRRMDRCAVGFGTDGRMGRPSRGSSAQEAVVAHHPRGHEASLLGGEMQALEPKRRSVRRPPATRKHTFGSGLRAGVHAQKTWMRCRRERRTPRKRQSCIGGVGSVCRRYPSKRNGVGSVPTLGQTQRKRSPPALRTGERVGKPLAIASRETREGRIQ
mmetsp:Transcript_9779/g.59492  ORF Transcript_9779/g.59492 Transcript_9779/m.59492 type:complete len:208 (+) Transcript_9779:903-1526(+)